MSRGRSQCQCRSYSWRKLASQRRSRRRCWAISESLAEKKVYKRVRLRENREIELKSFWCTLERHSTEDENWHHSEGESRRNVDRLAGGLSASEDAEVADHPHGKYSADNFPAHTTNVIYTPWVVDLKGSPFPKFKFWIGDSILYRA